MELNLKNYFSIEADTEYMSVSQYKNFKSCEAKALNDLKNEHLEQKSSFLQGHLFEELVAGDAEKFIEKNSKELLSSRGPTAGQLKSEYKKIVEIAENFKKQKLFMDAIEKSEKQIILTGKIEDVSVKCCLDLLDVKSNAIYDIKCMADFKEQWNSSEKKYIPWYYNWGYVLQLAVYREISKQNFKKDFNTFLMATTKENQPDIQGLKIDNELLDLELDEFKQNIKHFDNIKKGIEFPKRCEHCDFCKKTKILNEWKIIK